VYQKLGVPLVDLALNGGLATMFAYGQTGSGKTFTTQGILMNIAKDLFERQSEKVRDENGNSVLSLYVTFIQILGSETHDLLDGQEVMVGENKFGKVDILKATEVEITSAAQFLTLNDQAASNRTTKSTFKNDTSSRSHAVCKIRIKNNALPSLEDGELFIIDLAGSENNADSQFHDKETLKQS
jgi:kinesin family protein 2/24